MTTPGSLASRDPHQLSAVNIATYQLISTQDASAELEAAAIEDWRDQLGVRTVVLDECHHLLDPLGAGHQGAA